MSFGKKIGDFFFGILRSMLLASKYYHMSSKEAAEVTADAFRAYCQSMSLLKNSKTLSPADQREFVAKSIEFIDYDRKKIAEIFYYRSVYGHQRMKLLGAMDSQLKFRSLELELGLEPIA